jgi:IS5 family transposase
LACRRSSWRRSTGSSTRWASSSKRGTLVDATIIAGSVRRPYEGGGVNPRDPEARFTRKRDKTYFGYKAHLAVDEESDLVRQAEMTPANVHDSRLDSSLGEALIHGDEQGYFADRAYDSQTLRETLERAAWSTESPGRSSTPATRSSPGKSSTTPGRRTSAQPSSAPSPR